MIIFLFLPLNQGSEALRKNLSFSTVLGVRKQKGLELKSSFSLENWFPGCNNAASNKAALAESALETLHSKPSPAVKLHRTFCIQVLALNPTGKMRKPHINPNYMNKALTLGTVPQPPTSGPCYRPARECEGSFPAHRDFQDSHLSAKHQLSAAGWSPIWLAPQIAPQLWEPQVQNSHGVFNRVSDTGPKT